MGRIIRLFAGMAAVLLLAGCATLFQDDFTHETAGSPPDLSPAGPPVGDSIQILGGTSSTVRVIAADTEFRSPSLLYSYSPTVSNVSFNGINTAEFPTEYWVAWNGLESGSSPPALRFTAGNYNKGWADLSIQNHRFYVGSHVFGSVARGSVHTVIMHVDN